MAADEHVHEGQFGSRVNWASGQYPMFMTADELADPSVFQHGDVVGGRQSHGEVVAQKLRESRNRPYPWFPSDPEYDEGLVTLYDSIKKRGVREPVRVDPPNREKRWYESDGVDTSMPQVINGHHRIFTAAQIQQETGTTKWIPVEWTDESDY